MRRLWGFLIPYKWPVALCVALSLAAAGLRLSQPVIIHDALDYVARERDEGVIARKAALYDVLTHLGPSDEDALIVKTADRLANVRAAHAGNPGLLKMYRKEHPQFVDAVHRNGILTNAWLEMAERLGL